MAARTRSDPDRILPACHHISAVGLVQPYSDACQECVERNDNWNDVWLCLSCGWVACSNDSPNRHARAHYEETDHPITADVRPGSQTHWCHVHQRTV